MTLAPLGIGEALTALREHPGVRDAAIARSSSGPTVFVVPKDCYLDRVLGRENSEQRRLQAWRKTYDLMQLGKDAETAPFGFNTAGWKSSYTRQAIPTDEMREWVGSTVNNILSLAPRNVLEIGCGSGLLLFEIAPKCQRYVGTDFSSVTLKRVRQQMESRGGEWNGVELVERSAENLEGFAEHSFDTVVINSVVQYFPSLGYCSRVLRNVIRLIKPGGHLLIGDCRSLPLARMYAASLELRDFKPENTPAEFAQRMQRRTEREEELLLSPSYFVSLTEQVEGISVEVRPKRGLIDNELSRYRFDVFFSIMQQHEEGESVEWHDWCDEEWSASKVQTLLFTGKCGVLALSGIPNSRLQPDLEILAKLGRGNGASPGVEDWRIHSEPRAVDPQTIWNLAIKTGYTANVSWNRSRSDGSFDVVFVPEKMEIGPIRWPKPLARDTVHFANWPGQAGILKRLRDELSSVYSKEQPRIIFVDSIPTRNDGTADEDALVASARQTYLRS